jgi:hypothetical protein
MKRIKKHVRLNKRIIFFTTTGGGVVVVVVVYLNAFSATLAGNCAL